MRIQLADENDILVRCSGVNVRVKFVTTSDKPAFKHRSENRRDGYGIWESRV